MGIIDSLEGAGSVIKNYLSDRFGSLGNAYKTAWTDDFPKGFHNMWNGVLTMSMSQGDNRDSFWKGLGLFLDGAVVGMGGGALKGTVGGLFEAPVLHEAGWLLDKAYRYSAAYPLTWAGTWSTYSRADMREAVR